MTFGVAGIGFLGGFSTTMCLLLFPNDNAVRIEIANLVQQNVDQLKPLEAAELAYNEAQEKYDNLANLHKLRTECERVSREKERLQDEYDALLQRHKEMPK